jgi:hypothetical protein
MPGLSGASRRREGIKKFGEKQDEEVIEGIQRNKYLLT